MRLFLFCFFLSFFFLSLFCFFPDALGIMVRPLRLGHVYVQFHGNRGFAPQSSWLNNGSAWIDLDKKPRIRETNMRDCYSGGEPWLISLSLCLDIHNIPVLLSHVN
ncbi:hypothetical protein BX600DRAFT_453156 [Xylariales sp. PMI_506]|nr:hypothetical protein BX600DRAFT_453156 [Xylariales sp. PMI_506]